MKGIVKVAMAQLAPIWLDKQLTLERIIETIEEAGGMKTDLLVFGEGYLPGYPFWLAYTDGAAWNLEVNKEMHAHYANNAISISKGDLDIVCKLASELKMAIYLGAIERAEDRGGHSLYCSLIYIDTEGIIQSVHRKLQPTYDERLTWAPGDGHGLRVHSLGKFTVGGLNCWENWMPLVRAALYGMGEDLHVAVWPGSEHNTKDITRFIARESRSYVVSVSSTMRKADFPKETPHLQEILKRAPDMLANGGSCIAGPDGEWIIPPVIGKEGLFYADLEFDKILQERQNFDPVGHYSRPDVTRLKLDRTRQSTLEIEEEINTSKRDNS